MGNRWLLVDDHAMFRAGLRLLLQSRYPDDAVEEAGDGAAAMERALDFKPDMIILDLHLPDLNGLEVTRQILARCPATKIIILSAESNLAYVNEALMAGVSAYLLKTSASEELPRAVAAVMAGALYLCPEANAAVIEDYRRALTNRTAGRPRLSAREQEVLRLTAEGLRSKEIAARIGVGAKTIETYRRRVMEKLGCGSTAELVRYAVREGLTKA